MKTRIYNPYYQIAGYRSLLYGVKIILITVVLSYLTNTHFSGNFQFSHQLLPENFSLILAEHLISWLVLAGLFYISGLLLSHSSIRLVDVLGTTALARMPFLIIPFFGLIPAYLQTQHKIISMVIQGEQVQFAPFETVLYVFVVLLSLLLVVWFEALNYHAYRVSCNMKHTRLWLSFVIILIISEVLVRFLMHRLLYQ
ncbi:MAG: hypothetical protein ACNS62_24550 [Candidatus Cyclobacteriaceae bacterium M3_2C_046]